MKVLKNHRYRARIHLGMLEQVSPNSLIASKFAEVGLQNVTVQGTGRDRWAFGEWRGEDTDADLPSQVVDVTDLGPC